jgi:hypothetical protein
MPEVIIRTRFESSNWPEIATRAEWARLLGKSTALLHYHDKVGNLAYIKNGYNTYYTKEEVFRWLERY